MELLNEAKSCFCVVVVPSVLDVVQETKGPMMIPRVRAQGPKQSRWSVMLSVPFDIGTTGHLSLTPIFWWLNYIILVRAQYINLERFGFHILVDCWSYGCQFIQH